MPTRLNINIDEKLLSQLKIIATIEGTNVTDIVIGMIKAFVESKRKDALAIVTENFNNTDDKENVNTCATKEEQQILMNIANKNFSECYQADNNQWYLRYHKNIEAELNQAGLKLTPKQPKLRGKRQKGFLLPEAPTKPPITQN